MDGQCEINGQKNDKYNVVSYTFWAQTLRPYIGNMKRCVGAYGIRPHYIIYAYHHRYGRAIFSHFLLIQPQHLINLLRFLKWLTIENQTVE